jgi:alpha-L-fucosidase
MSAAADPPHCDIPSDLGFIFHWGPYSVPAFDDVKSAARRSTQNGSEWYLKRLQDRDKKYRPTSGTKETAAYHDEHHAGAKYEGFASRFLADKWDPDEWMKLCKSAGATYVLLTARHHDGFCLWPSYVAPDWNVGEVGPMRDLLAEFKAAAERHGLVFGVYYSWMEFGKSATMDYINEVPREQIEELIGYKPHVWFFDGSWEFKTKYSKAFMSEMVGKIHAAIPGALVNDRAGEDVADYRVFADRYMPDEAPGVPWVHVNTIGLSWGRNEQQKSDCYKSGAALKALIGKVRKLGGGVLLNFGPGPDGILDPHEKAHVEAMGNP